MEAREEQNVPEKTETTVIFQEFMSIAMIIPANIDPKVYLAIKNTYEKNKNSANGYQHIAFNQGSEKSK